MAEPVSYQVVEGVAWLTICRPEALNALSQAVLDGLWEGVRRFNDDGGARVLVLTGSGSRAFCAGADLKELAGTGPHVPGVGRVPQFGRNVDVPKPTIAAVNGLAYGGGFLLAHFCDLVVAVETATFGITEARVGRGAPWAATLPWQVPGRIALQLLLTGEPVDARRAHAVGMVNEVVRPDQLRDRVQAIGERIAANAPLTVRAGKAMVYRAAGLGREAAFEMAEELWAPVYLSEDAQEGPRAFREKRPPRWRGR